MKGEVYRALKRSLPGYEETRVGPLDLDFCCVDIALHDFQKKPPAKQLNCYEIDVVKGIEGLIKEVGSGIHENHSIDDLINGNVEFITKAASLKVKDRNNSLKRYPVTVSIAMIAGAAVIESFSLTLISQNLIKS